MQKDILSHVGQIFSLGETDKGWGMPTVYISLGSNLGDDPSTNLERARRELDRRGLNITAASKVYVTEPQDYADQPWFANQVVAVNCPNSLSAEGLLTLLLSIELRMGRVRSDDPELRYGPRIIDLDILLFDAEVIHTTKLHVPHPRLCERAFVLVPLLELDPGLCLPSGESLQDCLGRLDYTVAGVQIAQQS